MHPIVHRVIRFYPIVKKFPLPIALILLVVGGILYSYTIMLIGAVMLIARVWELAYEQQKLQAKEREDDAQATTTGSGG